MTDKPPPVDLQDDLNRRWQPTASAVRHARALLAAEPTAEAAMIPLYQPGKQRGVWTVHTIVETVPGVVILAADGRDVAPDVAAWSWARETAWAVARRGLRADGRRGTVAFAVVERELDHIAVFEDDGEEPAVKKGRNR